MITQQEIFIQAVNSNQWVIALPETAKMPTISGIFDNQDNPVDWDYTFGVDGSGDLIINFGIDEYQGKVLYEYLKDGQPPENNFITGTFTQNANIKVGELSNNNSIVEFKLEDSSGKVEIGKATIIKESQRIVCNVERHHIGTEFDLEYDGLLKSDGLYLSIISKEIRDYSLSYRFFNI